MTHVAAFPHTMNLLNNPRWEAFAQAIARGIPASAAYRSHVGTTATNRTSEVEGAKLAKHPEITLRVREIKLAADEVAREEIRFEKADAVAWLVRAIQMRPSEADLDNDLCDLAQARQGPWARMPAKLAALDHLSKLCGWYDTPKANEPTQQEDESLDEDELDAAILSLEAELNRRRRQKPKMEQVDQPQGE